METTQIDKLFLELAQFTKATTPSENRLQLRVEALTKVLQDIRVKSGIAGTMTHGELCRIINPIFK